MSKTLEACIKYDPLSGDLTWKTSGRGVKIGKRLGSPDGRGYVQLMFNRKKLMAHRLAWFLHYGKWPKAQIDHINGIRDDNRIENLRDVTQTENMRNAKLYATNKSGVNGIALKKCGRYQVTLYTDDGVINAYTGFDFFEACCIRKSFEISNNYHVNHGRRV